MFAPPLSLPPFFALWIFGGVLWLAASVALAGRDGLPRTAVAFALLALCPFVLVGARIHYLIEEGVVLRSILADPGSLLLPGFRLPGGLLLALAAFPLVAFAFQLPLRRFADCTLIFSGFALAFGRIACFLRGCCFGEPSSLPWAVQHPVDSYAYKMHLHEGFISDAAIASLPVHPFGLYLSLAALASVGLMLWLRNRGHQPGQLALAGVAVLALSSGLLETLREIDMVRSVPFRMFLPQFVGSVAAILYLISIRLPHGGNRLGVPS